MDPIYLDNNASTPVLPAVWEAMRPHFTEVAGNPASSHQAGRRARQALEDARECTAALLDASPDEVVFTSGATEANNLALFSLASNPPGRLLISSVEHPCVVEPVRQLAGSGFILDLVPVGTTGEVAPDTFRTLLGPDVRLAAVMLANHETGTVQPVQALAAVASKHGIPFHCDAAAAAGKLPLSFHSLGVTTLTVSAHKFHGPQGVGALLVRRGARLKPQLFGGHQQQGRRPGTEPVALAVGLAAALELAMAERQQRLVQVQRLRSLFLERLCARAAPVILNGPAEGGLPHTLNLSFPGCRADVLLMNLDLVGVACSTGSACSSGSLLPSPVLRAMGVADERLHSAMRFSLSFLLSEREVIEAAERVAKVVRRLRQGGSFSEPEA
ncbi:MAG: cysteine desulfurase [Gemmataceae bacterium]|nr:cysteine desulfurase [Gemmataceae bacterium]